MSREGSPTRDLDPMRMTRENIVKDAILQEVKDEEIEFGDITQMANKQLERKSELDTTVTDDKRPFTTETTRSRILPRAMSA